MPVCSGEGTSFASRGGRLGFTRMGALRMSEEGSCELPVERWIRGSTTHTIDRVAEETPVAFVYHGVPHVVMLATPANLEDFAAGFTLSEGFVGQAQEIRPL